MSSNSGWNCLLLPEVVSAALRIIAGRIVVVSVAGLDLAVLYELDTAAERGDMAAE